LQSVRDFAARICQEEQYIHVLINNAGVYQHPYTLTQDGLDMNMAANHFGHFLLVHLLLDKLKASGCPSHGIGITVPDVSCCISNLEAYNILSALELIVECRYCIFSVHAIVDSY